MSQYYSLPYCRETGKQRRHKHSLGETLSGSRKISTPYDITFLDPIPWRALCEEYMDLEDVIIHNNYIFISTNTIPSRLMNFGKQLKMTTFLNFSSTNYLCGDILERYHQYINFYSCTIYNQTSLNFQLGCTRRIPFG